MKLLALSLPFISRIRSKRVRWSITAALLAGVAFTVFANVYIQRANRDRLYSDVAAIPARETALVLGANSVMGDGRPNLHFVYRMDAAAALYHAGKVRRLLVSGDNGRVDYDEPAMMKTALIARGVPANAIVCDYAGFRTLDSVMRAKQVFGLHSLTIVTQRYHNTRALEVARANEIDAVGFCTRDVEARQSVRTEIREVASRTVAMLDLYVWHKQPRFPGPPEPLPPVSATGL